MSPPEVMVKRAAGRGCCVPVGLVDVEPLAEPEGSAARPGEAAEVLTFEPPEAPYPGTKTRAPAVTAAVAKLRPTNFRPKKVCMREVIKFPFKGILSWRLRRVGKGIRLREPIPMENHGWPECKRLRRRIGLYRPPGPASSPGPASARAPELSGRALSRRGVGAQTADEIPAAAGARVFLLA